MTQPADPLEVEPGRSSSLSVQAIGRGLRYQWCKRAEGEMCDGVVLLPVYIYVIKDKAKTLDTQSSQ